MLRILDRIELPSGLKSLNSDELLTLAAEVRQEIIRVVSSNGGHLASSLGTVELTIALHRVFESPRDKIIWDVGHQSYAHKLLTGRRERFSTLRQFGGISGFPSPGESPHDAFVGGHAGNSISAGLGMALARDLTPAEYHVIAVIGDGSLGEGMAFEAINHAGHLGKKLIVLLNDNGMSISPSVGALSRLLGKVKLDFRYSFAKRQAKTAVFHLPFGASAWTLGKRLKESLERVISPLAFWEELGFNYLGPLDGHNMREIESALVQARDVESGPVLIHAITQKGKGFAEAESNVVKYHGLSPAIKPSSPNPTYSQVFGRSVTRLMRDNSKIVAISAAMLEGGGLTEAAAEFPGRVFDVGISEQHAVTLAAGLASSGYIPAVSIYSTFLQRAYDQVIHDICLPNLPVIMAVDRAGIVGEDGKTHQGSFDTFLRCLPNMIIASPANEDDLQNLLYSALEFHRPVAIRYPRGYGQGIPLSTQFNKLECGKGELTRSGRDLTIVALGPLAYFALEAAEILAAEGVECSVINSRFAKPLDEELILSEIEQSRKILTIEDNSVQGGFGSAVLEMLSDNDIFDVKVKCLGLPDIFIEHGPQELFHSLYNLDPDGIVLTIHTAFPELFSSLPLKVREEA